MKNQRWKRGHISRFWAPSSYKDLEYKRQPITQEEVDTWESQGYDYVKSFTGSMYDSRNPMPDWLARFDVFFPEMTNMAYTFYKMSTLEIMPTHTDHYRTYCKIFDTEPEDVCRIIVFLEDWKPGHYFEIDGVGINNWIAGDWVMWEGKIPHAASNIGIEDRYTLQITTRKITSDDVWKCLHWYNVPGLKTKKESNDPALLRALEAITHNSYKPCFIYMYNEQIKQLEKIVHQPNDKQTISWSGIDIYLYEPLCSYMKDCKLEYVKGGTKHSNWFYSEFKGDEDANDLRADELDSILLYAKINNLDKDLIRVHTCDYDADKHYPFYNEFMTIIADDLFVKTAIPIYPDEVEPINVFTKKFMCLNWRYTQHRHLVAAYVSTLDSYCSWYYRADPYVISSSVWTDALAWANTDIDNFNKFLMGMEYLNRNSPLNVDLQIKESINITHKYFKQHFPNGVIYDANRQAIDDGKNNSLEPFYRNIFCDIVTESRFAQPTANYSEKVFHPMYYNKPFVLVAPPKTLEYLKSEGFKTFSDFWDESYDDEYDHEKRLFKIFKVIDYIDSKSIDELHEMYEKMIPILKHNFETVNKTVTPFLRDIWKK